MNELPPVPTDSFLRRAWSVYKCCLSKENYARLSGRAGRFEYWSTTIIGHLFCLLPVPCIFISPNILRLIELPLLLGLIIYLAMPMLAVYVRRLHDVGWSAWWIAIHYAVVCVVYAIGVFHVVEQTILYGDDIYYILQNVYEKMQPILHYSAKPMEILSIILFIVTLLPGNPKKNKYGEPV